jgi:hypothetical protein
MGLSKPYSELKEILALLMTDAHFHLSCYANKRFQYWAPQHPLHSLKRQCGMGYLPLALLVLTSLMMVWNVL